MRPKDILTYNQEIGAVLLFVGADLMINNGNITHSIVSSVISHKMVSDEIE